MVSDYIYTPLGVIVMDMMNTPMGMAVFARSDVNAYLKPILDDYGNLMRSEKSLKFFHK
jgi:hypothetical protein